MKNKFAPRPVVALIAAAALFVSAFAPVNIFAAPSTSTSVTSNTSSVLVIDNTATKRIVLMNDMTCAQFAGGLVLPAAGASVQLFNSAGAAIPNDSASSAMNVASITVTAEDGATQGTYSVGPVPASFAKNTTASYIQTDSAGYYPSANTVDCDANTRWSSYRGTADTLHFPEWIEVDLGAAYDLTKLNTLWYSSGSNRAYAFTVWAKDGIDTGWAGNVRARDFAADGFTQVIDESDNQLTGEVDGSFPAGTKARYVALLVSGANVGTNITAASLFTFDVFGTLDGCYLTSSVYAVDNTANTITTTTYGSSIAKADFMKNLAVQGAYQSLSINSGAAVATGDVVTLTDSSGSPRQYSVVINQAPKSEYVYDGGVRDRIILNDSWKFYKGSITGDAASATTYSDAAWSVVNLPHTWNAVDMTSGSIWTGDGWYRKSVTLNPSLQGDRIYLEFLAAGTVATVFVNGVQAGTPHRGAYEVFRYDITNLVTFAGANEIAVKCNNQNVADNVAPLGGDFNFYGGLTRSVSIVATNPVHIDMSDNASQGVYVTTPQVSAASASMDVKSKIVNDSGAAKNITVTATLKHPSSFDAVPGVTPRFTVDSQYTDGAVIGSMSQDFTVAPGGSAQFDSTMTVNNPRLWNGLKDPFRYMVYVDVYDNGVLVDEKTQYIGFRYFSIDTKTGFFLNGVSDPLRGVDRHFDRPGIGNAITTKEHDQDFSLMYDMGCNATRLAHFPQADYFYNLCDQYGMVVWAEIPFVNSVAGNYSYTAPDANCSAFMDNIRSQLNDMVKQNYNHPAIIFWGLENEVGSTYDTFMKSFIAELTTATHQLDPQRIVTLATNISQGINWPTDVCAWNRYDGWYSNSISSFPSSMGTFNKPTGVSEYGAGANNNQHSDNPLADFSSGVITPGGQFHPVEYQNIYHEHYLDVFNQRPDIWGSFVWNMFDFSVASRNEGSQPGMNDKGIITWDRQTKKDIFYLYKSDWTTDPVIHITSPTYTKRTQALIPVKVYSNCDSVAIIVNGVQVASLGAANQQQDVFTFDNIPLAFGSNTIEAVGTKNGTPYTDTVVWSRALSSSTNIASNSAAVTVNNTAHAINMYQAMTWAELQSYIVNANNAALTLQTAGGTPVDGGTVQPGMILHVVSEDGSATVNYTISAAPISLFKPAIASHEQNDGSGYFPTSYALDDNTTTRWSAYRGSAIWPEWIEVDLGAVYDLSQLNMSLYNSASRSYKYTVYGKTGDDPNWNATPVQSRNFVSEGFTAIADKSNNTATGDTHDVFAPGTKARYIAVNFTGGAGGATTGSIYELDLYGFNVTSTAYTVDSAANVITVPYKSQLPAVQDFMNNIAVNGNYTSFAYVGAGPNIIPGDYVQVTDMNGNQVKYYVKAVQLPYTVTFDAAGGAPAPDSQAVMPGGFAAAPTPAPTKAGYTFAGWFAPEAAAPFDFANTPITADLTLTAHWTAAPVYYTVVFDAAGGAPALTAQAVQAGGLAAAPTAAPTKAGYTFAGWFAPEAAAPFDFANTPITAGLTLTAHWTAAPVYYTVTFDAAGGAPAPTAQTVQAGGLAAEPAPPALTGYTFAGWYLGGALYNFSAPVTGSITLTAQWTPVYGPVPPTSITMSAAQTSLNMKVGTKLSLKITVSPANADPSVTWSSSNPAVATVDPVTGQVTALKTGSVRITVKSNLNPAASYMFLVMINA